MCDNSGPTLTIILTEYNQVFGFYTEVEWQASETYTSIDYEAQTFLFKVIDAQKIIYFEQQADWPNLFEVVNDSNHLCHLTDVVHIVSEAHKWKKNYALLS